VAQFASADTIGLPGFELFAMARHQLTEQVGVGRIILGPAGCERLAVTRQSDRVDREQDNKLDTAVSCTPLLSDQQKFTVISRRKV
jgi:hypothetical protein